MSGRDILLSILKNAARGDDYVFQFRRATFQSSEHVAGWWSLLKRASGRGRLLCAYEAALKRHSPHSFKDTDDRERLMCYAQPMLGKN
jgi:hypothetical protein